jgi:DNA-binding GntR family transcriptional regulator
MDRCRRSSRAASISTLLEALYRLTSEGLVVIETRGFEVAPLNAQEFVELAALRELLEALAMRQSFAAGTLDWEGQVVVAFHKLNRMEQLMLSGDRSRSMEWKQYAREFHRTLISACTSLQLLAAHAAFVDRFHRYQMIALSYRGRIAADEHRALHDCALSRHAAGARAVLEQHLQGGVSHALMTGTFDS